MENSLRFFKSPINKNKMVTSIQIRIYTKIACERIACQIICKQMLDFPIHVNHEMESECKSKL